VRRFSAAGRPNGHRQLVPAIGPVAKDTNLLNVCGSLDPALPFHRACRRRKAFLAVHRRTAGSEKHHIVVHQGQHAIEIAGSTCLQPGRHQRTNRLFITIHRFAAHFSGSLYSFALFVRITIIAISSARPRFTSPFLIISDKAIAIACRPVVVPIHAASSQPLSGPNAAASGAEKHPFRILQEPFPQPTENAAAPVQGP
jgi:hypothetical protein